MGYFRRERAGAILLSLLLLTSTLLAIPSIEAGDQGTAGPPADLSALPGDGEARLSWAPPEYNNGSEVTEYWVYRGAGEPLDLWATLGNVTTFLDVGLTNGRQYLYGVRAVNGDGPGNMSEVVSVTPRTVPSAPLDPTAKPGNGYMELRWEAPNFDGGAPILAYRVYGADGGFIGQTDTRNYVDSLLDLLSFHSYTVTAVNDAGEGERSEVFGGTVDIPPGTPSAISVVGGVNNVTLEWNAPRDNGGSDVAGYMVYRGNETAEPTPLIALGPGNRTYTDYGLDAGSRHCYRLSAFNLAGEGEPTLPVWANVSANASVYITSIIEGDSRIGLFWDVPENDTSRAIRYWLYRGDDPGNMTLIATNITERGHWDAGLVNGRTYYYALAVQTSSGLGWSETVPATPRTNPGAPVRLMAEGKLGHIELSWEAPLDDGGAEVLGYKVYMGRDGAQPVHLADVIASSYLSAALDVGVEYSFQVSAVNRAGEGTLSDVVHEVCGEIPSPPAHVNASWGQGFVRLIWTAPSDSGTGPVLSYEILRHGPSGQELFASASGQWNDTSVTNGAEYVYRVRAVNQVGEGAWSQEVRAWPDWNGDPPSRVTNLTATPGESHIQLAWSVPDDGGQPISGYMIFRGLTPDLLAFMVKTAGGSYNDTELPTGVTYYYKVVAVNVIGEGAASEIANATTAAPVEKRDVDIWTVLLTGAMPIVLAVLLAAVVIILFLGRRIFLGRRRTPPKQGARKNGNSATRDGRQSRPGGSGGDKGARQGGGRRP